MAIQPDMVGVVVADLRRSVEFYRMLGLPFALVGSNEDFAEVITPNGYRISLNKQTMMAGIHGQWEPPPVGTGQRLELAFKCDSPAHVDSTVATLRNAGHPVVKEPWNAFWGQRYAVVADPDGTHISLFAPL